MSFELLTKFADYPAWFKYTESFFIIGFVIFTIIGLLFLKPIKTISKEKKYNNPALTITDKAEGNIFDSCQIDGSVNIEKQAKDNKFINTKINK